MRIPLLHDHHSHPALYATVSEGLHLSDVREKDLALGALAESAGTMNSGDVFVAFGWNSGCYQLTSEDLADIPPMLVCNQSFHGYLLNDPAREALGDRYPDVTANLGNPDWVERNLNRILRFIFDLKGCSDQTLKHYYEKTLAPLGVYSIEEMLLPNAGVIDAYRRLGYAHRTRIWADFETYTQLTPDHQSAVHGIKLFTDGAIGTRTAAIGEPYLNSANQGILLYTDEALFDTLALIAREKKPIAIHAIGDRAIGQILQALVLLDREGRRLPSVRLEHAQFITEPQARTARDLGITLSMQPNFNSDSGWFRDRLSDEKRASNNPFRMLIDRVGFIPGGDLVFGSDGMPHGAEHAVQQALFPEFPVQTLTMDEFVAGYCVPDMTPGHIDLTIDFDTRTVSASVESHHLAVP